MCGIFGVCNFQGLTIEDRWDLRRLADATRHRGPDGEGFHVDERVGLGMTRLAIMDPESGWQPLVSEDRSVVLVANGEVYNSKELRRSLQHKGHTFATRSDCETILHLYEDHGDACVHELRGMFAFAILDIPKKRLLLARDRMGEKPLHVVRARNRLIFCSELRGLVGAGVVPADLNPDAVIDYFHWGFVPEPTSAIIGVETLPAGSMLAVDLVSGSITSRTYWSLLSAEPLQDAPVERIRSELDRLAPLVVQSDRPIGVSLSAGVDSSVIAVLAKRHATQPVEAISIGYPGNAWQDESWMARQFADQMGLPHHRVELEVDSIVRDFPTVCLCRDEPIADLAGSALYALAGASRELGLPVLMSGLGGDELFWGYQWIRECVRASNRARARQAGESNILSYLTVKRPPVSYVGLTRWLADVGGLRTALQLWTNDPNLPAHRVHFWNLSSEFRDAATHLPNLVGKALADRPVDPARYFSSIPSGQRADLAITDLICGTYLRTNGLAQTDRLFMAQGVEPRVPLVDAHLCETVIGLRKTHRDHDLPSKTWLKQAVSPWIPPEILNRRKTGFSPPWRTWLPHLVAQYRGRVMDGILVKEGMLTRSGVESITKSSDALGRPMPLTLPVLVLEMWIQGLRSSYSSRVRSSAEPHLPTPPGRVRS
jgi:asparagine synthase (glutamine-hydrolysing)